MANLVEQGKPERIGIEPPVIHHKKHPATNNFRGTVHLGAWDVGNDDKHYSRFEKFLVQQGKKPFMIASLSERKLGCVLKSFPVEFRRIGA